MSVSQTWKMRWEGTGGGRKVEYQLDEGTANLVYPHVVESPREPLDDICVPSQVFSPPVSSMVKVNITKLAIISVLFVIKTLNFIHIFTYCKRRGD